jgi:hypothetical protein
VRQILAQKGVLVRVDEIKSRILAVLRPGEAIPLAEVVARLRLAIPRRSLQRALKLLAEEGKILAKGGQRVRAYELNEALKATQAAPLSTNSTVRLSQAAEKLLQHLSLPLDLRPAVNYQENFLRGYVPNKTFYLSAEHRSHLLAVGKPSLEVSAAGTYARQILSRLMIDLSWNSSRLEGNTYSILDTQRLIEFGEKAEGKNATDTQMILNHKAAIEFLVENAKDVKFDRYTICNLHAILSDNLLGDPSASGRIRKVSVGIGKSSYQPLGNPHLIEEYFDEFLRKAQLIADPFEQAFFALVHLSYLQAFEDVNKRTSRIAANIPFVKENLIPLSFVDVPKDLYAKALLGIYEQNDISLFLDLFLWAYERSAEKYSAIQRAMGEPDQLKLKYRDQIQEGVRTLVMAKVPGSHASQAIERYVATLSLLEPDGKRILEIIENEILHLHEGNAARFRLKPAEFQAWKEKQKI